MTKTATPSLRERRKAETWTALHEAAASLALERGLEHATVGAIADSAGVSSRSRTGMKRGDAPAERPARPRNDDR